MSWRRTVTCARCGTEVEVLVQSPDPSVGIRGPYLEDTLHTTPDGEECDLSEEQEDRVLEDDGPDDDGPYDTKEEYDARFD